MTPHTSAPKAGICLLGEWPDRQLCARSKLVVEHAESDVSHVIFVAKTSCKISALSFSLAAASLLTAGCGGAIDSVTATTGAGPAFIVGTDAPLASVTSFAVQVQGINAIDSSGKSVALLSGSPTVDFARFNGLQTLLDMNSVPVGTYTSVAITLGPATIGYLNTVAGSAPTIQTQAATLTSSTINITPRCAAHHQPNPAGRPARGFRSA